MLNHGSYFGDISYIFKVKNLYYFESSRNKPAKIFALVDDALDNIFDSFPDFQKIFELRALRRQHYFKKLKNQMREFTKIKEDEDSRELSFDQSMERKCAVKKARLVEDQMSYEELIMQENFSEHEE
jgi:sulfur transfer complex TusBCD TusB component (DsrH family)